MPTKLTKTTKKIDSSKKNEIGKKSKVVSKKEVDKNPPKKVVVKRRKVDLKPSKASAVAIASQANRTRKQALIEKVARSDISQNKKVESADTRIPLWVWIFFGCSLMLFCISFYQAIILRPQVETKLANDAVGNSVYSGEISETEDEGVVSLSINNEENDLGDIQSGGQEIVFNPQNPEELIQSYFAYMSAGNFDESFNLFDSRTQNDKNIREHFTAFRMAPFFEGIEGNFIVPQNIHKISEVYNGNEVYVFDISYVLKSTHEKYDETWKFATSNRDGNIKILMLYCVSSKCSRHPIFGPEEFGLMR